jgi:hypothetical protein
MTSSDMMPIPGFMKICSLGTLRGDVYKGSVDSTHLTMPFLNEQYFSNIDLMYTFPASVSFYHDDGGGCRQKDQQRRICSSVIELPRRDETRRDESQKSSRTQNRDGSPEQHVQRSILYSCSKVYVVNTAAERLVIHISQNGLAKW